MVKNIRKAQKKRKTLEEKWIGLKRELATGKVVTQYKSVKGDEIDAVFMEALNQADIDLRVKRISQGKYLFGSKNITAKLTNGKLLIRVGGGHLGVHEFIKK